MLVALALMPLSMASPVAAGPVPSAGHCDDQQKPADEPSAPKAHCAACAALPAIEIAKAVSDLRPTALLDVAADLWIAEPGPETDTPPPKLG